MPKVDFNTVNVQFGSFCTLTGLTYDKAKDYLEAANWDINEAMSNYFDSAQAENSPPSIPATSLQSTTSPLTAKATTTTSSL